MSQAAVTINWPYQIKLSLILSGKKTVTSRSLERCCKAILAMFGNRWGVGPSFANGVAISSIVATSVAINIKDY